MPASSTRGSTQPSPRGATRVGSSGGAAGDGPAERAVAAASRKTTPLSATPTQVVCQSESLGSSTKAAVRVPSTAPPVLTA